jgi:uncharacterized SAM-binding protein YcdF (DUF218 family)
MVPSCPTRGAAANVEHGHGTIGDVVGLSRVNEIFLALGIESWKPVLSVFLLPPVPLLLLVLLGARWILWRRALGWITVLVAVAGLWLGSCAAVGEWLQHTLTPPPPVLSKERQVELRRGAAAQPGSVAVVVLGGGSESLAPEYGMPSLSPYALERLRYGIWLSREIGAPMAFSGGPGHAAPGTRPEAEIASEIALREFARSVRWVEGQSRDTRENALYTVRLLRDSGVRRLVVVTHGWHMPRALRAFREAVSHARLDWEVVPAPMGLAPRVERPVLRWMPSPEGFQLVRAVCREKLGWWLGA